MTMHELQQKMTELAELQKQTERQVQETNREAERVLRSGIYLARIHDEEFELQVPEGFQPRAF